MQIQFENFNVHIKHQNWKRNCYLCAFNCSKDDQKVLGFSHTHTDRKTTCEQKVCSLKHLVDERDQSWPDRTSNNHSLQLWWTKKHLNLEVDDEEEDIRFHSCQSRTRIWGCHEHRYSPKLDSWGLVEDQVIFLLIFSCPVWLSLCSW